MKMRNIVLAIRDQMPLLRFLRNLWKGHLFGLLHERSHMTHRGTPKVQYSAKAKAQKAAEQMSKKTGTHFSNYKCLRCDGYHVGKNSENKY